MNREMQAACWREKNGLQAGSADAGLGVLSYERMRAAADRFLAARGQTVSRAGWIERRKRKLWLDLQAGRLSEEARAAVLRDPVNAPYFKKFQAEEAGR